MSAKSSGDGNLRIELDEIAIRRAVARDDLPERRNGGERIGVVDAVQHRQVDARKFEAEKPSAVLQHPMGFGERPLDARHVADAESDGVGVEPPIRQRQSLRVGFDKGHPIIEAAFPRALRSDAQHVGVDVGDRHRGLRAARPRDPECDVARAACDVEMGEGPRGRRMRLGDENVLPYAVQAEGHQIVHQVVAVGDLAEDVVHQALLFIQPYGAFAEMRLVGRKRHQGSPMGRRKASRGKPIA